MPHSSPADSPWLRVREAAAYSRRSVNALREAYRAKELPIHQAVPNGLILIHRDELEKWLRRKADDAEPAEHATA